MQQVIALMLIVAVSSSLQHAIETGGAELKSTFVIPNFKSNWYKAVEYCNYRGMKLVTIENRRKESNLYNAIQASDVYRTGMKIWVGASDLAEQNREFHWHDTGRLFVYARWGSRQPDNRGGVEHCMEVVLDNEKYWNDNDCKAMRYFVCEISEKKDGKFPDC